MGTLESFSQHLVQVLHLHETPHRTALAFAIGVFIAFAPHYLFHTASALFVSWAFRLNFLAVLLGALLNNPWTLIPILAASLYTGLFLTGTSSAVTIDWEHLTASNVYESLSPYVLPFVVGSSFLALVCGALAYPIMRWTIIRYRNMKVSSS
ncbi:MAG: DUF2062 domain-containing protein [Nitrospirales bacterium]|nr:DUF2062 domain-containing protein [Nitrospirales bacterium]